MVYKKVARHYYDKLWEARLIVEEYGHGIITELVGRAGYSPIFEGSVHELVGRASWCQWQLSEKERHHHEAVLELRRQINYIRRQRRLGLPPGL